MALTALIIVVCILLLLCGLLLIIIFRSNQTAQTLSSAPSQFLKFDLRDYLNAQKIRARIAELGLTSRQIKTPDELAEVSAQIISLTKEILPVASAEIILADNQNGVFHSSGFLGTPLDKHLHIYKSVREAIVFAGKQIGEIHVMLEPEQDLDKSQQEILKELAAQCAIAVLNSNYSRELVRLRRAAEESTKAKTGFLANLSHEIRGPLGLILNAVEIVSEGITGAVNEKQAKTLGLVRKNGNHLLDLINDVLDYAKIEAGKLLPKQEILNAQELLAEISKMHNPLAIAKQQQLEFIPAETEMYFACDRRHARQILINLLTNAIKYTPDQGHIKVWAEKLTHNRIKLNVQDSGVGIPAEEQHKVFQAFERMSDAYSQSQLGTGLGMPLAKKLTELNNGRIDFTSEQGKGSHFYLTFDACQKAEINSVAEATVGIEKLKTASSISLYQSDESESEIHKNFLLSLGFTVNLSKSLQEQPDKSDFIIIDNSVLDENDINQISKFKLDNNIKEG